MPEPTPTTDKKGLSKKTIYIIAGIGGLGLVLLWKSKKKSEGKTSEETNPYTAQAFIPVTAENVGGVGAGGGSLGTSEGSQGLIEAQEKNQEFITNLLKTENERQELQSKSENERFEKLIERITNQTGGGSPSSGQNPGGGGTASPPSGGTPPAPPVPPVYPPGPGPTPPGPGPTIVKCPSSYPLYNPANGPVGANSCYKYSHERCADKARPYKHVYQNGKIVCSSV
jgi:hypothetical protein